MTVFISPYSSKLPNGRKNPKDYPYWNELIALILNDGHDVVQVGVGSEKPLVEHTLFDLKIPDLLQEVKNDMDTFISVDNFFPHFCAYYKRFGIVLWGQSDPQIFGYHQNVNLFMGRRFFRPQQFEMWTQVECNDEAFMDPATVFVNFKEN